MNTESQVFGEYIDYGIVLDGAAVAAGATQYGGLVEKLHWARRALLLVQCDQVHDVVMTRQDASGTESLEITLATGLAANAGGWRPVALLDGNSVLGYAARFGIKNTAAAATTTAKIRLQLMG